MILVYYEIVENDVGDAGILYTLLSAWFLVAYQLDKIFIIIIIDCLFFDYCFKGT